MLYETAEELQGIEIPNRMFVLKNIKKTRVNAATDIL
jgi:hypothetical protein